MSNTKLPLRQASIHLFGRLTRDTELTYTPENKPTCGFSVAVERWTGKERVSWFANCRLFGPQAEKFKGMKGDPVYVTGEPYVEEWATREGEKRKDFKVMVQSVDTLQWPDDDAKSDQRSNSARAQAAAKASPPPRQQHIEIPDDDIPF